MPVCAATIRNREQLLSNQSVSTALSRQDTLQHDEGGDATGEAHTASPVQQRDFFSPGMSILGRPIRLYAGRRDFGNGGAEPAAGVVSEPPINSRVEPSGMGWPMKIRLKHAPPGNFGTETILQPAADAGERREVCCPKREVVAGSGPHLTKETQGLLQSRLRAAAVVLLIGFGVFLVRHVAGWFTGERCLPCCWAFTCWWCSY